MTNKEGKIIKALSGFYYVLSENNIIECRARGNFRNNKIIPLVGDIVTIKKENDSLGYIIDIQERENELIRPKIANVDYNIIVTSLKEPEFSSKLLDKLIVLNEYSDVKTIIIFTKWDLLDLEEKLKYEKIFNYYESLGYIILKNNTEDTDKLKKYISGKYVSISGQSGSGKSTFINKLSSGKFELETAKISKMLGRGKHTTRHIEFHKIDDFYIADTPGFSSLDITFIEKEDLKYLFIEFSKEDCKYLTCNHIDEPNCGVKNILDDSYILERYNNYKILFKEKEETKRRY
ncbi:ribosome small subunit-dependent GTPase A [Gemelliphila palaticanis]|uniref:Small ribosomal subunit biogenesis GTPase RsgA n=1 Tax=Gemelliphila palaticanis TaxID=81950 RepID=A0ABX2T1C3_9BACL|nr:ribosome small subunit-dependent GTPase A [Gemella palaticanis]MBF0715289.1 ribosome small subunit-dependent GTPase A [Gemella palaticanis]NYS47219.1 ribosome small subunit-dependent GTPase A [Gemella palaticanis]